MLLAVATTDGTPVPVHVTVVLLAGAVAEHAARTPAGMLPVRKATPQRHTFREWCFILSPPKLTGVGSNLDRVSGYSTDIETGTGKVRSVVI
jgi:hypothetical protein